LEDDGTFSLLVNFIRDDRSGDISLRKLKEGIEKERDARFLHEDLIELVRENRMDIDRVFRNYDYNASQSMEIHEFERLVRTLQPDVSTSVVDVLFKKFDSNNEGSISLRKFRSRITGGSGGVTTQGDIKNLQIQHFIEDLDSLLQDRKLKFDSVFGELTHQGTIKVDDFKDALKILGFPVDEDKTRMKLIIQSLILYNKQNRINVKLFKDYYNKSKKNNDDGEFVFSTEDMRRVENFSNLIERKLTRVLY
jgi:Ca2+-binding EF-hand superfamily protein